MRVTKMAERLENPGTAGDHCASCGGEVSVFYQVPGVPVHSVLRLTDRSAALSFPTGDIRLAHCHGCGFIANVAFDPARLRYAPGYEGTQAFSPTFNRFHHRLARRLIDTYDLRHKSIVEIGCGHGEFLSILCELGDNRGIGFDPSHEDADGGDDRVRLVPDVFSEKQAHGDADFICCKMTLEHIADVAGFVTRIRRTVGERRDTLVFFQVPDAMRILRQAAFWDVYYEHCSYFTPESLGSLFRRCGFSVVESWIDYEDQYAMVVTRPGPEGETPPFGADDRRAIHEAVSSFPHRVTAKISYWRDTVRDLARQGRPVALWGAGSKAVSFLTTLGLSEEVGCLVDVNPRKHGTYTPGTGHEIVSPEKLRLHRPDVVIIMNPIYADEIGNHLHRMGIDARILAL